MKKLIALFPLAFICMVLQAQQTDSTTTKRKITITTGLSVNSGLNYYGRTDSLKSQGIYPFVGITLPNGLYLFSNFIFVRNAVATTYAATTLEAGYKFRNKKENFRGNLFGSRFLYNEDVSLVQSVLKGQAGINLIHTNKIVGIYGGADAKFSDKTDFGVYAGLDHSFRIDSIGKRGVIVIAPAVYGYFGTQRFTKTWLQQKRFLFIPVGEQTVTASSSRFDLLSYELSCPVIYGIGKMNIIITPAFVLPQNVITANGQSTPEADALFYTTATVRFDL
ncbi:hypothetical protein [Longitalea luteola]|uniref:hypothetical protein n=1 Tax=Longitalea luteola TaxID=2812563 RepID=UPI001A968CB6|nr:hypothetical protein [Longitalea luteola]